MTVLSLQQILQARADEELIIEPFDDERQYRPDSVVLRLGNEAIRFRPGDQPVDPYDKESVESIIEETIEFEELVIPPNTFILGSTIEAFALPPHLFGLISNLSNLARWGLDVHLGSFFVHSGFGEGCPSTLTLEISHRFPAPIKLHAGMPICQIAFMRVDTPFDNSYHKKRATTGGQTGPRPSGYYKEFTPD